MNYAKVQERALEAGKILEQARKLLNAMAFEQATKLQHRDRPAMPDEEISRRIADLLADAESELKRTLDEIEGSE